METKQQEITIENGGFTTIFNEVTTTTVDGKRMTPEAIGVYFTMMSLPPNWDFSVAGLEQIINAGRDKIRRILKELETYGYLVRYQTKNKGRFSTVNYKLFGKTQLENNTPLTEKPNSVNTTQVITKEEKRDKKNDKGENPPSFSNHFLTNALIEKKFIDILDINLNDFNELFFNLDKEFGYELVLTATRYLVDKLLKMPKESFNNKFNYFSNSLENNLKSLASSSDNKPNWINEYQTEIENLDSSSDMDSFLNKFWNKTSKIN